MSVAVSDRGTVSKSTRGDSEEELTRVERHTKKGLREDDDVWITLSELMSEETS